MMLLLPSVLCRDKCGGWGEVRRGESRTVRDLKKWRRGRGIIGSIPYVVVTWSSCWVIALTMLLLHSVLSRDKCVCVWGWGGWGVGGTERGQDCQRPEKVGEGGGRIIGSIPYVVVT